MEYTKSKTSMYRRVVSEDNQMGIHLTTRNSIQSPAFMEILHFDIRTKNATKVNISQVLEIAASDLTKSEPFVLIMIGLEDERIWEVRKAFDLHPLLDSECENSFFNNKDSLLTFENFLFLTMNDADYRTDDVESPISIKLILKSNFMLIFSEDDLNCIEKIFRAGFDEEIVDYEQKLIVSQEKELSVEDMWLDISEVYGCSLVEVILHRIYEALYFRFERFIVDTDIEARECMNSCRVIGPNDRVEFIIKLNENQRRLIYLNDLINPKFKIIEKLIKSKQISEGMKYYMCSFLSKTVVFQQRLRMSKSMLTTAEHIYSVQVDQALKNYSDKLNNISRYFSAISAIFLPLNLASAYFGMNVMVPGVDGTNYNYFLGLCGFCIAVFILLVIYYKIKRWI